MSFTNSYQDRARAEAYATLEFANTYYLAFRDLPALCEKHVSGRRALDFGCGAGRSTRLLRSLGFEAVGVDISEDMVAKAHELDPGGDYRLIPGDDLSQFPPDSFDLVLSAFTFDNIAGANIKTRIFVDLAATLAPRGKIISIVSTPEIYLNEWASFSTKDFVAENARAKAGDIVRIITTDHADARPVEDIVWPDDAYRDVYRTAGIEVVEMLKPLATGSEPYEWRTEMQIAPWAVYVLQRCNSTA